MYILQVTKFKYLRWAKARECQLLDKEKVAS